jgi:CheY-like chemotaxis protein
MRIAYIEDNTANLALVRRVARIGQHEVQGYAEGQEALTAILADPPDLILVDIQLGGEMDGLTLTRALRAAGITHPIIAVTAYAMIGDRERCITAGCTDYLPKPLPISELVALFEAYSSPSEDTPIEA